MSKTFKNSSTDKLAQLKEYIAVRQDTYYLAKQVLSLLKFFLTLAKKYMHMGYLPCLISTLQKISYLLVWKRETITHNPVTNLKILSYA